MSGAERIVRIDPAAGIPGGEVAIECEGLDRDSIRSRQVMFGSARAWLVGASPRRVLAIVPEVDGGRAVEVMFADGDAARGIGAEMTVGTKLADDLHLVASPAFAPDDGSLYVTRSGSRGQRMPVSLLRIEADARLTTIDGEVVNPTGIAFNGSGQMFVASRMDGTVYRVTPFDDVEPFAKNLGVATGLAFDRDDRMYVGDRTGTIHRCQRHRGVGRVGDS